MALWFKNLVCYQLDRAWTLTPGALEALLAQRPLKPCSAMSLQSNGWIAPIEDGGLVRDLERHLLIALGMEQKLLPSSVVNDEAKLKAQEFERSRGFKPGRKMMKDLKDQAAIELMPRAFARRREVRAWIDPAANRLVVDTASIAQAEILVEELRAALGELAVSIPNADPSPAVTLTQWLTTGAAPSPFMLEDECELTGNDQSKSVVRYLRHPLDNPQIQRHLEAGMHVTRLGLSWNSRISFVLNDKLQLRRLRFLEMEEADDAGSAQADAFEAEFALMSGQLSAMLRDLDRVLGIQPPA